MSETVRGSNLFEPRFVTVDEHYLRALEEVEAVARSWLNNDDAAVPWSQEAFKRMTMDALRNLDAIRYRIAHEAASTQRSRD